jgi:hypothetical protein
MPDEEGEGDNEARTGKSQRMRRKEWMKSNQYGPYALGDRRVTGVRDRKK